MMIEKQYIYCGLTYKLILQGIVYFYQVPSAMNFLGSQDGQDGNQHCVEANHQGICPDRA